MAKTTVCGKMTGDSTPVGGLSAACKAKYPRATVPALELDAGTVIGDAKVCVLLSYLHQRRVLSYLFSKRAVADSDAQ